MSRKAPAEYNAVLAGGARALINLQKVFSFLSDKKNEEFTVPELTKRRLPGSVAYDLLNGFVKHNIIKKTRDKASAGAFGATEVFKLTVPGKMIVSFATGDNELLVSAMSDLHAREDNSALA